MSEDDDPVLAALLRRLRAMGDGHDPDGDGLWDRVSPDAATPAATRGAGRRPSVLVASLAAAGAVGVIIATQTLGGDPSGTPSPAAQGIPTIPAPSAPPPTSAAPAAVDPGITLVAAADQLVVRTPDDLDWVVTGGRNDGAAVRAKRPVGGRALTVTSPGGAVVEPSGGVLSWVDGAPEQDRTTTTWLAANGDWTITVAPAPSARVLVIHAGRATGLRVTAGRASRTFRTVPGERFDVRVELPPTMTTVRLTPDGRLAISAVTLRR